MVFKCVCIYLKELWNEIMKERREREISCIDSQMTVTLGSGPDRSWKLRTSSGVPHE